MNKPLRKLLYIEDDDNIAEVTKMTLEDLGDFHVMRCKSGQEAIDQFAGFNPQMVISDVMMPNMDGPETLSRLRKTSQGKNTPVVFMTAKAQLHEQKVYTDLGALGVIVKPFDPIKLCDQICSFWESHLEFRKAQA